MTIGDDVVRARILEAKPDVETTDPITAGIAGLSHLGCRKIAVLTPYSDEVNAVVDRFITSKGVAIGARGSFKRERSAELCRVAPESIYDAGLVLGKANVDGLFISCTALRVSGGGCQIPKVVAQLSNCVDEGREVLRREVVFDMCETKML